MAFVYSEVTLTCVTGENVMDLVTVSVEVLDWMLVTVAVLVIVVVAVVVTVVVVIKPAGLGEHPICDVLLAPADPRGGMTETDAPPLFAT